MKVDIVLGLAFGDEGKGVTTSFLSKQTLSEETVVIRFNGGHQAGHTVLDEEGHRHIFSNFGSGTMNGVPTYWSRFCTVYPRAVVAEYKVLEKYNPTLIVHPLCPVTTPFDVIANRVKEDEVRQDGSCGVGFGTTIQRSESYYNLYIQDLYVESIWRGKLLNIMSYYQKVIDRLTKTELARILSEFEESIEELKKIIDVQSEEALLHFEHLVFEGAQGVLLDMDFGFFPNVTRSNTTSKNALDIIYELQAMLDEDEEIETEVWYVTRAYQTRHGNGHMTGEGQGLELINNEKETNTENVWQGKFRIGALDIDLLTYGIMCDEHFSKGLTQNLVITCLDQVDRKNLPVIRKGVLEKLDIGTVYNEFTDLVHKLYISESSKGELMRVII